MFPSLFVARAILGVPIGYRLADDAKAASAKGWCVGPFDIQQEVSTTLVPKRGQQRPERQKRHAELRVQLGLDVEAALRSVLAMAKRGRLLFATRVLYPDSPVDAARRFTPKPAASAPSAAAASSTGPLAGPAAPAEPAAEAREALAAPAAAGSKATSLPAAREALAVPAAAGSKAISSPAAREALAVPAGESDPKKCRIGQAPRPPPRSESSSSSSSSSAASTSSPSSCSDEAYDPQEARRLALRSEREKGRSYTNLRQIIPIERLEIELSFARGFPAISSAQAQTDVNPEGDIGKRAGLFNASLHAAALAFLERPAKTVSMPRMAIRAARNIRQRAGIAGNAAIPMTTRRRILKTQPIFSITGVCCEAAWS